MTTEKTHNESSIIDRLALSRAQHLKSRNNRRKSISDEEDDAISDWSESDLECSPLSDFESTSNIDGTTECNYYDIPFDDINDQIDEILPTESDLLANGLRLSDTALPVINDSTTSTRISFSTDIDRFKQQEQSLNINNKQPSTQIRKPPQTPLLPARRIQTKQVSPRRLTANSHILPPSTHVSYNRKTITPSHSRLYLRRGTVSTNMSTNTHSTKESTSSSNSSIQSNDENHHHHHHHHPPPSLSTHQRHVTVSPNFSHTSTNNNNVISRIYEVKKLYVDDYDYGRLSDLTMVKSVPSRSRQKWGTIVHPPFPLGYQHIPPEQVSQTVERLTSPVRRRDRHTPVQTPSKRFLSVEETDALISRLTKVKPIRSPDQYWPIHQQTRAVKSLNNTLKTSNNWKGVGISA
ncbi:hypothetical protein I4U23_028714 [Adineta vaga]|nr:hypothetical protein I4U23_028714 [Adineta vaga]